VGAEHIAVGRRLRRLPLRREWRKYDRVAFVPGRDSRGYVDGEVELETTYFYVVKATTGRRDSREIQTQADTPSVCLF
jgi:hypothetical protein